MGGVRRFQNEDGSLTPAGARRQGRIERKFNKKLAKSEKYDAKILAKRDQNRGKIENKYGKKISRLQADIDSFKPITNGLKDNKGRDILTAQDVSSITKSLQSKIDALSQKRDAKIKDFDTGTEYVKAGFKAYNDVIKKARDAKVSAITNAGYNKSEEYRAAIKNYVTQRANDRYYGVGMTKLQYTSMVARADQQAKQLEALKRR